MLLPAFGTTFGGSEDFVDGTIANLKIIGMLQKNGKLCVRRGQLSVDREDHLQAVRRWLSKDSREVTLMHIRNTVNSALKIAGGLLSAPLLHVPQQPLAAAAANAGPPASRPRLVEPTATANLFDTEGAAAPCDAQPQPQPQQPQPPTAAHGDLSFWTLGRLVEEMRHCEAGLQNLRTTYIDDSMTVAAIDVLADRLRANCDDIEARVQARLAAQA